MLIYDVLHKEKVYQIVANNLRGLGVKYRIKKSALVKTTEKQPERTNNGNTQKVFKTHLSYLPLDVVSLKTGAIVQVPLFVSQATDFLLKHADEEGLFRKAGSQIRQREIVSRLDSGGTLGDKNNPIDVANCLKSFFRNLPEPLIPYVYHDLFVRCNMLKSNNSRVNALLMACILLPPTHLNTLAYLMEFLRTVASHESQNKMSIDNLARVIGPNLMPLQETTMVAVQSRLDAHLNIVKLLIENSDKIGVLPNDISEAISMDAIGSMDNELDQSDPSSSFKNKKKKHRSGSLTRMLSGLKKIVGKNHSPTGADASDCNLLRSESNLNLHTPSIKAGKKRKVVETNESSYIKKKCYWLEAMPTISFSSTYLFSTPVSQNPNPGREKSPNQKTGVQKYLSQKIHSDARTGDKSKKLRLSLDRFSLAKSSKHSNNSTKASSKNSLSPSGLPSERRWSASKKNSPDSAKRRRTRSVVADLSPNKVEASKTPLEEVFMDAEVNLSDNSANSYSSPQEEYVKIPKSEYEEIKSRVSAIETCISQEFKNIRGDEELAGADDVQSKYERTLEEASIESTASTDQLAKRLSRELKIRRSGEHRVIRSPSARKIGSIRRRSQDKPVVSKKLHRTSTWHISSDRPEVRRSILKSNSVSSSNPRSCNLKRGRPLVKQRGIDSSSYKSLDQICTPKKGGSSSNLVTFCSDETNARLDYLQKQLNTLISHTAEHTRGASASFSDEDFAPLGDDDVVFKPSNILSEDNGTSLAKSSMVRRASSFHCNSSTRGVEYFDDKIKDIKKSTSQQNLKLDLPEASPAPPKTIMYNKQATPTPRKEKTVSWKDADDYFKQEEAKMLTPLPTTGRASVAKLRTQNAGMVLAKAKLFDFDPTGSAAAIRRQSVKLHLQAGPRKEPGSRTPNYSGGKKSMISESSRRRQQQQQHSINNTNRRSPNSSPMIKMEVTINSGRRQSSRFNSPRSAQKENHHQSSLTYDNVPTTPHIKKPLSVKTPKSAKSLSAARRSVMNGNYSAGRRTPLKAVVPITPKRQSPRIVLKSSTQLGRHMN